MLRAVLLTLTALGVGLHLYQLLFEFDGPRGLFAIGLTLWSCLPYVLALLLARRAAAPAVGFALGALLGDVWMHHAVFIAPGSSTAALGLLFMPLYNMVLLGPAGAVLAWALTRLRPARSS
jgi:hypothetical protein